MMTVENLAIIARFSTGRIHRNLPFSCDRRLRYGKPPAMLDIDRVWQKPGKEERMVRAKDEAMIMEIKATPACEGERPTYSETWDMVKIPSARSSAIHGANKNLDTHNRVMDYVRSKTKIVARQ